jgi:hypothetical protein
MRANLRRLVCADGPSAAAVDDGGRFVFVYSDRSGRHLFDATVDSCHV